MELLLKHAALQCKALAASTPTRQELLTHLKQAQAIAHRVEAGRAVQGFLSDGLLGVIDSFLAVATPFIAFSGDFELSNLLGSLKVWLDKKRLQAQREEQERQAIQGKGWNDLNFNYTF